ncbi:MAG: P-loop NTPase [Pirellulales bacterium]|nr:P-loop NTPase [Pirellulales bacterium]
MTDQANELRRLVAASRPSSGSSRARSKRVVVTSGKGGVGTTTIAVNLAVALAGQRYRTLLVDADPDRHDATMLCRLDDGCLPKRSVEMRHSLEESLQPGPGGISVLTGLPHEVEITDDGGLPGHEPLRVLNHRFDVIVFDAGNGSGPRVQTLWQSADLVLLLTTPEVPALMDAYASAKLLATQAAGVPVYSLVNMTPDTPTAHDVHQRLAQACQRFLGITLGAGGHVPSDGRVVQAGNEGEPVVLADPVCPAATPFRSLVPLVAAAAQIGLPTAEAA